MAGGGGEEGARTLIQTPSWAVALVCAVIIVISLLLEKGLHHIGEWLTKKQKRALYEALEKVKAELMILGFISLLLTFGQNYVAKICILEDVANTMLPCRGQQEETGNRRLLDFPYASMTSSHRILAGAASPVKCKEGKVPLISTEAIHQLHIFIFFLAVFHVAYSASTMALGRAKIRRWKEWEKETVSPNYEFSNDQSRFRFTHETSFVRQHTNFWTRIRLLFYLACFFRQFFRSVRKVDYLTMRHGFVAVHLSPGAKFNFQKYIKRSLEDDFKVVVGISPLLWASAVIFLLVNVREWYALFWVTLLPLVILLAVGTKLQAIVAQMALEIQERHAVVQGIPLVQLSDKHFWFSRPQLILSLVHFTLFQNAFQITYFFWIWYEYSLNSCFHERLELVIGRVVLGFFVLFLCSYITLPLYALVTQMGSHMKRSIFDDQTSKALRKWQQTAKKKHQKPTGGSPKASPKHIERVMTTGRQARSRSIRLGGSRTYYSDHEVSDIEADASPRLPSGGGNHDIRPSEGQHPRDKTNGEDDVSFAKA
ncbi:MLO-like protein 9 isoform X1 [Nymphaea colorata]|nr:MLO-like protein 9 isoform X1 [Nymphaea colorata]XP_031489827.1 MLO-like protein 9 isoform X1 [Nymphaea colorata]XP_049934796.1 MLO-like protein 9 isoform X1 [Nymphaea colorata]